MVSARFKVELGAAARIPAPLVAPPAILLTALATSKLVSLAKLCCRSARPSTLLVVTFATTADKSRLGLPSTSSRVSTTVSTALLKVAVTWAGSILVLPRPLTAFLVIALIALLAFIPGTEAAFWTAFLVMA